MVRCVSLMIIDQINRLSCLQVYYDIVHVLDRYIYVRYIYVLLLVALLYHIFVPQISLLDIDFWKWELNSKEMKDRHNNQMYPPRIKMEVSMANTTQSLLKLCFHGCKSKNGKDITVERILPKGLCMCMDVHVLPACLTMILDLAR